MDTFELFQRLSLALAIGFLIGVERGWQQRGEAAGERTAGLRTHALGGLLGGVAGALALELGPGGGVAIASAFALYAGTIALYRYRETGRDGTFGATTAVAAMLSFLIGAYAVVGDMAAAAAAGAATAGMLALKNVLHTWLGRIAWPELRSALVLAAMTFLLLPVLPNRAIDPFGAVNLHTVWLSTVLIAGISFAGYLAVKLAGERLGILATGLAGGVASSTAATLMLARLARAHPETGGLLAAGAILAGAVMMARVILLVAVVRFPLLQQIAAPVAAAGLTLGAGALLLTRRHRRTPPGHEALALANPFDFFEVLRLGALLAVLGLAAGAATAKAGVSGAYAVAAISGLVDVDAVTLAVARIDPGQLAQQAAGQAILVAVAVNTISKAAMAAVAGGRSVALPMFAASVVALAAGTAVHLFAGS